MKTLKSFFGKNNETTISEFKNDALTQSMLSMIRGGEGEERQVCLPGEESNQYSLESDPWLL